MQEQAHPHRGPQELRKLSHPAPTTTRPMVAPPPIQEGHKGATTSQQGVQYSVHQEIHQMDTYSVWLSCQYHVAQYVKSR